MKTDEQYLSAAQTLYEPIDAIILDVTPDNPIVRDAEKHEGGAWVPALVWVDDREVEA